MTDRTNKYDLHPLHVSKILQATALFEKRLIQTNNLKTIKKLIVAHCKL